MQCWWQHIRCSPTPPFGFRRRRTCLTAARRPKMKATDIAKQTIPQPTPAALEPVTHVALVIDTSASMGRIMSQARDMALQQYNTLVRESIVKGMKVHLDVWAFGFRDAPMH